MSEKVRVNFYDLTLNEKLRYVLNAESSSDATRICCTFLKNIYSKRLQDREALAGPS